MSRHFFSPEMKVLLLYIFINNIEDHLSSTLTKSGKISMEVGSTDSLLEIREVVGSNQVYQTRDNGDQEEIIIFDFLSVVTEFSEMKVLLLYIFINNIEDHLSSTLTKSGKISMEVGSTDMLTTYSFVKVFKSLGRVGMPHGSMPVSRSSGNGAEGYSSSSTKTYVDNASNRSLGKYYCCIFLLTISKTTFLVH
jgi:Uri superfamily endonuclease